MRWYFYWITGDFWCSARAVAVPLQQIADSYRRNGTRLWWLYTCISRLPTLPPLLSNLITRQVLPVVRVGDHRSVFCCKPTAQREPPVIASWHPHKLHHIFTYLPLFEDAEISLEANVSPSGSQSRKLPSLPKGHEHITVAQILVGAGHLVDCHSVSNL